MRKRVGRRLTEDDLPKEDALRLWRQARPVQVERQRAESSVLSVRLPHHVFDELVAEAQRQGKGPATLARELIEEGLARKEEASPALLFRRVAQLLEDRAVRAALVRFIQVSGGGVVQPRAGSLWPSSWATFMPGRPGTQLPETTTRTPTVHTKVEVQRA